MKNNIIAAINTGSSSIKAALFTFSHSNGNDLSFFSSLKASITKESIELVSTSSTGESARKIVQTPRVSHHAQDLEFALRIFLKELTLSFPNSNIDFGHRVVHGGLRFTGSAIVDEEVQNALETLIPLAPLHQPAALAAIKLCAEMYPLATQVACFDTTFHRSHPWVSETYGLPRKLYDEGIRRYGFHGISYEFVVHKMNALTPRKIDERTIIAHLGNGSSMCALKGGESIATTMGFTSLDGLPMGTRPGQLDPGIILYLLQQKQMSVEDITELLYHQSGLLGLSGISSDMKVLLESNEKNAQDAVAYYVHRAVCSIGELAATLQGLDTFIFTGGIGENASLIRKKIAEQLGWMGVVIDDEKNELTGTTDRIISSSSSVVTVWVIHTNEEEVIAHHTCNLIRKIKK